MAGVITRFKLDGGTNQAAARRILPPEGLIRRAVNLRLRRDNELEQRPGFTALAMDVYGQISPRTAILHDLISYDGRLFALGTVSNLPSKVTLFEYLGLVKGWKRIVTQIPGGTRVREIGNPADQAGGVDSATCAAYNGIVCLAYVALDAGYVPYAHVFRASDDATIVFQKLTAMITGSEVQATCALVSLGHVFHVVGWSGTGASVLQVQSFTASTDEAFSNGTSLQAASSAIFAAAAVGTSVGGYVTVSTSAGNLIVRHYNDSHVQQMTRTINTVVPNYLAIAADGTADRIIIGYIDNADNLIKSRIIKLSDGTSVSGPTTLSATTTVGGVSVAIDSSANTQVTGNITNAFPRNAVTAGAIASSITWADLQLTTEAFFTGDGNTPDNMIFAGFVHGSDNSNNQQVNGLLSHNVDSSVMYPGFFKDFGTGIADPRRLGSLCKDTVTGKFYLAALSTNNDLEKMVTVTEFSWDALERRQTAIAGGLLHIAGALPLTFDGRSPFEISWGEAPVIYGLTSSNTASGAITSSAAYFVQVFPEMVDARGNVHRGPPSIVYSITTGAADDTISGIVSRLHSFRNNSVFFPGASYRLVFCRTAALADKTAGENLYRETHVTAPFSTTPGLPVAFTLITSDAGLRALGGTQGTIYTQSQTPIPDQAPPPCRFVATTNDRLGVSGMPRGEQVLESKLLFPAEAVAFADSDLVQYQYRTSEAVRGIARLGSNRVAFTRNEIHLWQGEGPDSSGVGEFSYAGCLSHEGGLVDLDGWRSLCETDEGTFFQREFDQICLLTKSGGIDRKVGEAVRDELVAYPVVTAAVFLRRSHQVAFAVQTAAADAGEILIYDLRRKVWFIDDVGVVDALAEYQGRLVYCTHAGAAFQQDALPGTGSMPTQVLDTFDFDFGSGQSWGAILNTGMVGEYEADAMLALSITYDTGLNYTAIGSWAITAANGYSAGKLFSEKKAIPDPRCARFGLRWQISGSSGSAGLRINEITLETETAPGMQRLPARDTQ